MVINLDLNKYHKLEENLSLEDFILLQAIYEEKDIEKLYSILTWPDSFIETINFLEIKGWIKKIEDKIYPRQKLLDLFSESNELSFEQFWDKYHQISKKPKSDKEPAKKYWKSLTKTYKKLAYDKIQDYITHTINTMGWKYIKKARTYLSDKSFTDEFDIKPIESNSINEMG